MSDTHHRRGSDASVYSFENQPVLPARTLPDVSLAPKHWLGDLGVVRWLTERVEQEPLFKEKLLVIVERSKTDADVRQAAANAITILIRAGVQFNGADLKGIRIPGADLSDGVFDHAQLQGADLRKVILRKIWLRQANLDGAKMTGVQFGEWPFLEEDSAVITCMYSPDGKLCAVGLHNGTISVYEASNWKKIHTLHGHTGDVRSVVYSPNGQQIASGSADATVRLWDAQFGKPGHTLSGHSGPVWSVVYSPNGQQIASGSQDPTVRLWDVASGQCIAVIRGFHKTVLSVAWNVTRDRNYLVTGCRDRSVRLWQVIKEGDQYQVRLRWSSTHALLTVTDTSIQGVQGLSRMNKQLLKQRGAISEPSLPLNLHETDKKITSMPSNRGALDILPTKQSNPSTGKSVSSTNKQCLFSHFS